MSHSTFTVTVVDLNEGTHGALAAKFIVDKENEKRAAQEPPVDPLPVEPWADLKASYLTVLTATIQSAHENYIKQQADKQAADDELTERWMVGGEADRAAALAALPAVGTPVEVVAHEGEPEVHHEEETP